MLLVEESITTNKRLIDTKKVYLDALARNYQKENPAHVKKLVRAVRTVLDAMEAAFADEDELLQAQGNVIVYYLAFRSAIASKEVGKITRRKLLRPLRIEFADAFYHVTSRGNQRASIFPGDDDRRECWRSSPS